MYNPNARYESVNAESCDVAYVAHVQRAPAVDANDILLISLTTTAPDNGGWEDPGVVAVNLVDIRMTEADAKHLLELLQHALNSITLGERRL